MLNIFKTKKIILLEKELEEEISIYKERNLILKEKISAEVQSEVNDLLKLPMSFAKVDDDGYPIHPLSLMEEEARKQAIIKLEQIYHDKTFMLILDYWIDLFGNHAVRSSTELEKNAGRFSINGVFKIKKDLKEFHQEFVEIQKPKGDFDKFSINPE